MVELPPFRDPSLARVHAKVAAWAGDQGWTAGELRRLGSRLERTWTDGVPGTGEMPAPGTTRAALSVFVHSDATASFGLQYAAGRRDAGGKGLHLRVVTGGSPVTPDQVVIEVQQGHEPPVAVGAPLGWHVGERFVETARPNGLDAVSMHVAAYSAWGDTATLDLDALEAVVHPVLDRGEYTMCDYGPSPGNGIPGPCLPRTPTKAEQAAHRAEFDAEMARRRAAVADPAWPALFMAVAPPF